MLDRGDAVPHFEVRTVGGDVFGYSTIWQQKNLVLITLSPNASDGSYVSELSSLSSELPLESQVRRYGAERDAALEAAGR